METCTQYPLTESDLKLLNVRLVKQNIEEKILDIVLALCQVSIDDIKRDTKGKREICDARHIAIALIHKYTSLDCNRIGFMLNRDPSTIINSLRASEGLISHDREFRDKYEECKSEIIIKYFTNGITKIS